MLPARRNVHYSLPAANNGQGKGKSTGKIQTSPNHRSQRNVVQAKSLGKKRGFEETTSNGSKVEDAPLRSGGSHAVHTQVPLQEVDEAQARPFVKVPCTIIAGGLGSGKTTLLNNILRSQHWKYFGVIQNEIGEVDLDHGIGNHAELTVEDRVVENSNGCFCCRVRGDLIRAIKDLFTKSTTKRKPIDGILMETTGLADLSLVIQTFMKDEFVKRSCNLDGILIVIDAKQIMQQLRAENIDCDENFSMNQLAFADCIVLNKTDLLDEETLLEVERRIRSINPFVPVRRTLQGEVDMKHVLAIDGWSLDRVMDMYDDFLQDCPEYKLAMGHYVVSCKIVDDLVKGYNLAGKEVFTAQVPSGEDAFGPWLWRTAKDQIFKGRLHLVDTKGNDIWVEPMHEGLNSVDIDIAGEVDEMKSRRWLEQLVQEMDLFRFKGVLAMRGQNAPFLFQGMYRRIKASAHHERVWQVDERKRCKLSFIGKNLKREEIVTQFMNCMAK